MMMMPILIRKLLTTVLVYSFAEVLEDLIAKEKKEKCAGCQVDHQSQHKHECMMQSEMEHLNKHFPSVYSSFSILQVLHQFSSDVKILNLSQDVICNFFLLNVIVLDTLHNPSTKDSVFRLLQKRVRASE